MTNQFAKPLRLHRSTRRSFLKGSAVLAAAVALPGAFAGARIASAQGASIIFWQYRDPPGAPQFKYFEGAAKRFKEKTGIDVQMEFKSAEIIEQAVAAAANAGKGFDAMLWWSGPTARNQGSLGNVAPLDDLFPKEVWDNKLGLAAQRYEGKTYGMSHTIGQYFLVYNKTLLTKAGVDPTTIPVASADPIAWDAFLDICSKVKASGVAPLMWANKEGYFNEWYFYNFEAQSFDSDEEIAKTNSGESTWTNPDVHAALNAYKQLYDMKFFIEGGEVVPYEQHVRQLGSGQAAMSVYFDLSGGATQAAIEAFGAENVGFSKVPNYRNDKKLYGHVCLEPNSFYIASFTPNMEASVKWIAHLVGPEEIDIFTEETQLAPADKRFNPALIKNKSAAEVYQGASSKGVVYPYTFVTQAQYQSLLQNGIEFMTGRWTAEQLTADWDKVDKEYLEQQKKG